MGRKILMLTILLNVIFTGFYLTETYAANIQDGGLLPWTQVNQDGFGNPENQQIPSLAVFNGFLYAGVWQWHEDNSYAEVWRTDGTGWEKVDHRQLIGCAALITFESHLYCGSWADGVSNGVIWRTSDGINWTEDVNYASAGIARFANYNGKLYASTWDHAGVGTKIWSTSNGVDWALDTTPGFNGDINNGGAISSETFLGDLYWGVCNWTSGAQIWRTDGETYEQLIADGFGNTENSVVSALSAFGSFLYASIANLTDIEVWRSADGEIWERVLVLPIYLAPSSEVLITGLEVLDGNLYLVGRNDEIGLGLWRTSNGTEWDLVASEGFGDGNNKLSYWDNAITTYKNKLYVGTINYVTGGEVWTSFPYQTYLALVW